eukprot:2423989-Ditylum_brightwellii.AAC.1
MAEPQIWIPSDLTKETSVLGGYCSGRSEVLDFYLDCKKYSLINISPLYVRLKSLAVWLLSSKRYCTVVYTSLLNG